MLSFIAERAAEEAPALVRPGGERLTYASLAMAASAVMQALGTRVGDVSRRVVAVAVADLAGFVASALAVLEAGGVLLPLDARAAPAATEAEAMRARAVAIIVGDAATDELQVAAADAARVEQPVDVCLVVEGAIFTRARLAAAVDAEVSRRALAPTSRVTPSGPAHRAAVLVGEVLATLRAGGTLTYEGPSAP